MSQKIKIELVKSPIGRLPKQRKTLKALGLGKMHSTVIHEKNPVIEGMVRAVAHLVKVEEIA